METEKDPNGLDQNAPGAKMDEGKLLPNLVLGDFVNALEAVVTVGTKGANKYTPHGWLSVPNGIDRYSEAALRHWIAHNKGEIFDPELKTRHLANMVWNLLAVVELTILEANAHEIHHKDDSLQK